MRGITKQPPTAEVNLLILRERFLCNLRTAYTRISSHHRWSSVGGHIAPILFVKSTFRSFTVTDQRAIFATLRTSAELDSAHFPSVTTTRSIIISTRSSVARVPFICFRRIVTQSGLRFVFRSCK